MVLQNRFIYNNKNKKVIKLHLIQIIYKILIKLNPNLVLRNWILNALNPLKIKTIKILIIKNLLKLLMKYKL